MSLVDAGMVPFQKAYVMICKRRLVPRNVFINSVPHKSP